MSFQENGAKSSVTTILVVVVSLIIPLAAGRGTWNASGQYEYYVSPGGDSRPYDDAQAYCTGQGGELALVKTQEIQQFIQTLVTDTGDSDRPYGFFIGLRDIGSNGTFIWNDGGALSYTNWMKSEPNHIGSETCVVMGWIYTYIANLPWYDIQCTISTDGPRGFVCQRFISTTSLSTFSTTAGTTANVETEMTTKARQTENSTTSIMTTEFEIETSQTHQKSMNITSTHSSDQSQPHPNTTSASSSSAFPDWAIAASSVAGVVFLCATIISLRFFIHTRRNRKNQLNMNKDLELVHKNSEEQMRNTEDDNKEEEIEEDGNEVPQVLQVIPDKDTENETLTINEEDGNQEDTYDRLDHVRRETDDVLKRTAVVGTSCDINTKVTSASIYDVPKFQKKTLLDGQYCANGGIEKKNCKSEDSIEKSHIAVDQMLDVRAQLESCQALDSSVCKQVDQEATIVSIDQNASKKAVKRINLKREKSSDGRITSSQQGTELKPRLKDGVSLSQEKKYHAIAVDNQESVPVEPDDDQCETGLDIYATVTKAQNI